jgi:hypothetical protein
MIKTIGIEALIVFVHLILVKFRIIPGNFNHLLNIDIFLFILFVLGIIIVFPGIKKGGENFSIRFLIMTTLQLLLMLSLILVLSFTKIEQVKILGFSSISVFVILLLVQSVVLIKKMNK